MRGGWLLGAGTKVVHLCGLPTDIPTPAGPGLLTLCKALCSIQPSFRGQALSERDGVSAV